MERLEPLIDPRSLPDLVWHASGQCELGGELLELERRLDRTFVAWARTEGAAERRFPPTLPAADVERLDTFRCFPQLLTFPVALDPDPAGLRAFADGARVGPDGALALPATAPVRDVLLSAACYPVYAHLRGRVLEGQRVVTTRAVCFRREERYLPLERQWSFSMREIVCLGSAPEVADFLARARSRLDAFAERIDLPFGWRTATDSFFDPARNPKYLVQKVEPLKHEMVFGGRVAIASTNRHLSGFGQAFDISRDGEPVHSGCVAFGLERWLLAIVARFGPDPGGWPDPEQAG